VEVPLGKGFFIDLEDLSPDGLMMGGISKLLQARRGGGGGGVFNLVNRVDD
jgi:hypothetical protein